MIETMTPTPRKKIRLTSLFFTIGIALMAVNLFMEVTRILIDVQPHAIGGAVVALFSSVLAQLKDA